MEIIFTFRLHYSSLKKQTWTIEGYVSPMIANLCQSINLADVRILVWVVSQRIRGFVCQWKMCATKTVTYGTTIVALTVDLTLQMFQSIGYFANLWSAWNMLTALSQGQLNVVCKNMLTKNAVVSDPGYEFWNLIRHNSNYSKCSPNYRHKQD